MSGLPQPSDVDFARTHVVFVPIARITAPTLLSASPQSRDLAGSLYEAVEWASRESVGRHRSRVGRKCEGDAKMPSDSMNPKGAKSVIFATRRCAPKNRSLF